MAHYSRYPGQFANDYRQLLLRYTETRIVVLAFSGKKNTYRLFCDHNGVFEDDPTDGLVTCGCGSATWICVELAVTVEKYGQVNLCARIHF